MLATVHRWPRSAEVLRHRNPKTTAIYAKVDLASLRHTSPSNGRSIDEHVAESLQEYLAIVAL